jgi:hypothetical protein
VQEVTAYFDRKLLANGGDEREVQPKNDKLKLAGEEVE